MNKLERFGPVFLISGVGFFLLSLFGMGLSGWFMIKDLPPDPLVMAAQNAKDPAMRLQLASEARGRKLFMSYGCLHCHTQFVRPLNDEPLRYGPASNQNEYTTEIPHLFGTRRTGPDLAREGGKRTDDWHFAHFYNPRYTVPESNMPGFPWMFTQKSDGTFEPGEEAKDLVNYMQSLGRAKKDKLHQAANEIYGGTTIATIGFPTDAELKAILVKRGGQLYERECAGCHGVKLDGQGPGAPFMKVRVQNLAASQWDPTHVIQVMMTGVAGTSMPSFREMSFDNMRAIAAYVTDPSNHRAEDPWPQGQDPATLLEKGQAVYANCMACHGPNGEAPIVMGVDTPRPARFTHQRPNREEVWRVLEQGVPGTMMAPFAQLSTEDKFAVTAFVQSLYKGPLVDGAKP